MSSKLIANRYRIEKQIGKGNYGKVFKAYDIIMDRYVAIKSMIQGIQKMKDVYGLLKLEIRILNRLRHPSIIKLLDSFEDHDGTYYLVYEMCRDGDLASKIQKKGRLSEEESLQILKEIASAFVYLRDQEIIHRDMKPENVFLDGPDIKIGDFGLCNQGQIFHDKAFVGSIAFQAPEIHTKKVYSSLTDVYAIGVCFYEMLMGKLPFTS